MCVCVYGARGILCCALFLSLFLRLICVFVALADFAKHGLLILVGEIPRFRNFQYYYCYYYGKGYSSKVFVMTSVVQLAVCVSSTQSQTEINCVFFSEAAPGVCADLITNCNETVCTEEPDYGWVLCPKTCYGINCAGTPRSANSLFSPWVSIS